MGKAFWYKNKKIIEVGIKEYKTKVDDVRENGKTHIHDLVDNPEVFGLTDEKVKSIYKKYNENVGCEGKARDEIMKMVLANGWVRVRHQTSRGNDYWIIQFNSFTKQKKDIQNLIAKLILDMKVMYKTDRVLLNGLDGFNEIYDGFKNPSNSILSILEGKEENITVITEYSDFVDKYFNY